MNWYEYQCEIAKTVSTSAACPRSARVGCMTVTAEVITKVCTKCGEGKPVTEFARDSRRRDGLQGRCRPCNAAAVREYRRLNPGRYFSLWVDEWDAILEWQEGRCAICGTDDPGDRAWRTDHDHSCCSIKSRSCGLCVRGLLCLGCNARTIASIDAEIAAGRLAPDCHPYLRDNWTHHREEWRTAHPELAPS